MKRLRLCAVGRAAIAAACLFAMADWSRAQALDGPGGNQNGGLADRGSRHGHKKDAQKSDPGFERDAKKILKHHPEADRNSDGRLSSDEAREYLGANPQVRRELTSKQPKPDADHDGRLSHKEMKATEDKSDAKARKKILKHHPDADTNRDGQLSDDELGAVKPKYARRLAKAAASRPETPDAAQAQTLEAAKRARKEAKHGELGQVERDPWVRYVEKFCDRYRLDAAQGATAQSILRECLDRRAKLSPQEVAQAVAGKDKPKAAARREKTGADHLFDELKQRLDRIPTSGQRAATQPASPGKN